jgi:hypothetical protein
MSGSGGGGGGGGDSYDNDSPCDRLRFEAQLSSPQPSVVVTLKVGDVLDVAVSTMKGQVVVQVLTNGHVAGGLAGPDATRLRNCMDQGHQYNATVRAVNGGQVRVFVEHI